MSWSKQQQTRLLKVVQESVFSSFKPQLVKLFAALRKDPQKYQCLVEILGKLIGSNEFDKVIDIIGEFDTQSDWKSGDQQLALAENVQPILTLFRNVKLDQNVKENAFLDCVRLLGAAMTRNSNVKRLMTKKFNLLKFLIEKMAELRHGDSQVEVLKQIFRLAPQDQKDAFCSNLGLDRSFQAVNAKDFNNSARKFLQGFNYARKVNHVSFAQLDNVQGSLGKNNFKTICNFPTQCDFNHDGLSIPSVSQTLELETLDLPYSDMMEWRYSAIENHPGTFVIETRMNQSWVVDNKYLSIRFEVTDDVFAEVESLFQTNAINMWHGAVVRNPLSVKVTKPTLDEGNVNERHKNEKWHKEASQDISTTLDKYLKMEELEKYMEDKENIPPAKEVRKYQIKSLPQNSLGSSSPLMVPVPFKLPDSPEVPDSTDILASPLKQDSEFKRSFSVESLPEPGQKVKSSADSVNASKGLSVNELSDMASKIPTPVPKVGKLAKLTTASSSKPSGSIKQNALDKSKTPKPANFEGLSSGGILADFADGLLSSPKKGPKQVSKPNNESDSGKVPKTGLQKQPSNPAKSKRARDSSDTVPSRYESNDDSYVEEPEVKRPSRSTKKLQLTKKVEPVKPAAKKAILPNQHNEIEDLMSDVEPVSSQERKKTAKKAALRNVASDVEERLPKAYVPRRSPAGKGRKPLKPWLEDASTKSKSIAEKFNPVVSRMLTSPLVPESSKLLGKSTKPFSSNMKTASATKMGNLIARDVTKKKPVSTPVSLPKRPMLKHSLSLIEDSPAKLQKSPSCNPAYGTPLKLDLSLSQQSIDSNQLGGKYLLDETPLGKISRKIGQLYEAHVKNTLNQVTQRLHQKKPIVLQNTFKKSIRKRIECTLAYKSKLKKIGDELDRLAKTSSVF